MVVKFAIDNLTKSIVRQRHCAMQKRRRERKDSRDRGSETGEYGRATREKSRWQTARAIYTTSKWSN